MASTSGIGIFAEPKTSAAIGEADSPRSMLARVRANRLSRPSAKTADSEFAPPIPTVSAASTRQSAQMPAFAPLLEELEVAGWSSHRRMLSGNFHDWLLLEDRMLLVMASQTVATEANEAIDPTEMALVAQGAWASIRSHAHHSRDAGTLLSLAGSSFWSNVGAELQAAVAVALVDLDGGHASVAMAGDCLALRIRAAGAEQIATRQPMLGADPHFSYLSHSVQLSLRERIVLMADEPLKRPAKMMSRIANSFSQLDAETHRRMLAADAIAVVRENYEPQNNECNRTAASIVAVRRR